MMYGIYGSYRNSPNHLPQKKKLYKITKTSTILEEN